MAQIIIGIALVLTSIFTVPKINNYYQGQKLIKLADSFYEKGIHEQALSKYIEAAKYTDNDVVINRIAMLTEIVESDKYFKLGSSSLDEKKWGEAMISFSKVSKKSKNYDQAVFLGNYAKDMLFQEEGENVKGVSTINAIDSIKTETTSTPTPTPTPTIIQTPTIIPTLIMPTNLVESNTLEKEIVYYTPTPTIDMRPRDSYGNLCTSYKSHCKYNCSVPDSNIDYRVNTIKIHNDQLNSCKSVLGANCFSWENGLRVDFESLIELCGSDFLNHL